MRKFFVVAAAFLMLTGYAASAHADLNSFLAGVNVQAKADLDGFGVRLSSQFSIPMPQVRAVIDAMPTPADAFMCFQLGQMTNTKPDVVVDTYKRNKGKGWGVIAQDLGIKPGSAEFHRLKSGDFELAGGHGGDDGKSGGKGKGKGRGK